MAQDMPNAPLQKRRTSSGYAASLDGFVAAYGGIEFGGDAIQRPGDGNNQTVLPGQVLILMNTSSSVATVTLSDDLANNHEGHIIIVKDVGGNANNNNITITAETDTNHDVDGSNQDLTIATANGEERLFVDAAADFWTW